MVESFSAYRRGENENDSIGIQIYSLLDNQSMHRFLNSEFVLYQILLQRILNGKHSSTSDQMSLLNYFKPEERSMKEIMTQFDTRYDKSQAIQWYLKETSIDQILNRSLQKLNLDDLRPFGTFLKDLYEQLTREHQLFLQKQTNLSNMKVFRGLFLSKDQFTRLTSNKGQFLSMNSLLLTTTNKEKALKYLTNRISSNEYSKGVIFEINLPFNSRTQPFANISHFNSFDQKEEEEEILFMFGSIFRIDDILNDQEKYSIVHLTLLDKNDSHLKSILTNIEEETKGQNDLIVIGNCFLRIFEYDQAEEYFEELLKSDLIVEQSSDIVYIYYGLANVFQKKGKYRLAIEYLHKTLNNLSKTDSLSYQCYNDLGDIYRNQNQPLLSLEYFEKALNKPNHLMFVTFFGLSQVHYQLSHYHLALQYLQKSFEDPSQMIKHFTAANLFLHMSKIHIAMNDQEEASQLLGKVLALQLKHLPSNHPDIAFTYSTFGLMHSQIGQEQKAIRYLEQALQIQEQTLPEKHPDFGQSYQYLADLFRKKGNLEQALLYDQKFLDNQLKTLSFNHPVIAQIHLNIANILWKLKDYQHAALFLKKVLHYHLDNQILGHSEISETFKLLGDLYLDQYNEQEDKTVLDDVLIFYQKYLQNELVTKTNLDFSLIEIYEIIAAIHFNHRHLDQALIYYNRLLDCHLQRHPPNSKTIEQIYNSIGKVYLKKHHVEPTLTFYEKQSQEENDHLSFLQRLKHSENLFFERRHLHQALDYFQTLSKTFPPEDPLLAQTHLILAHLHAEQNHLHLASHAFQQAFDLYQTIHPRDQNLMQKLERNIRHLLQPK